MSENKSSRFIPIIIAVSIVAGILIGTFYEQRFSESPKGFGIPHSSSNKLNGLLQIINAQYVDTVNINELIENAMPQILGELDPHSSYIPAKDLQAVNDDLKGSFSGIKTETEFGNNSEMKGITLQSNPPVSLRGKIDMMYLKK